MNADAVPPVVEEVCRACRFGHGEMRACVLLERNDEKTLLDEGPCDLAAFIVAETRRLIYRRYPFAKSAADDVASETLLRILETGHLLAEGRIAYLSILRLRIREMVRNAVIDTLRHHRLVTRIRCGACINFDTESPPPGCHLPFLPDFGSETRPNPWYGEEVQRKTDPRGLEPPCDAFTWRRPETHDIFAEEIPGMSAEGTPRERALHLLVQALDRLAQKDAGGLRASSVVFWHYLKGKSVKELADEGGVSDKTVKRVLADGRDRLLGILQEDFGVESVGELL
jgi:DNA-directed RNA polymerase specialized sigma24 family protein